MIGFGRSVQVRIALSLLALGLLTLVVSMIWLALEFRSAALVLQDRGLYKISEEIARAISVGPDGKLHVDLPPELRSQIEPLGPFGYTVNDEHMNVMCKSDSDVPHPLHPFHPHSGGQLEYFEHVNPDGGGTYYGATVQWDIEGRPVWIQVTREVDDPEELWQAMAGRFLQDAGWVIGPLIVAMLIASIYSVRRALSPIHAASQQAMRIGPGSTDVRLPTERMPKEVLPLVTAINSALNRLDQAFEAQKAFTAEAAHELLTPLAVLTAHLDTLEDRKTAAAIREDVNVMTDVVQQLLEVSELEALGVAPDGAVDLREVCRQAAERIAPLAERQGKTVAVTGAAHPVVVSGCEKTLVRALRNLIENALAHTAEGASIEVRLGEDGLVEVIDDGAGVPPEQRDVIFNRFWRGAGTREGGVGLGLSIVARIVEAHGGTIDVREAPGGGAIFAIRLPRPQA